MSSSKNNNLPIPNIATTSQAEFAPARQVANGLTRGPQQRSGVDQSNLSHRQRQSDRRGRGRGGRHTNGFFVRADRNHGDNRAFLDGPNLENNANSPDSLPAQEGGSLPSTSNGGSIRGYRPAAARGGAGGGSGKYKQRNHTNQLIDGLSSFDALDIDLAERLVPTNPHYQVESSSKGGRHASSARKVNLTHLLNYKSDSNKQHRSGNKQHSNELSTSSAHNRNRGGNSSHHYRDPGTLHKFSKQQFLQANCQFVVLEGHDYSIHKADPDWPVDWECIEEVRFKLSACTETTCPICLEFPVAAKITRCGHIYCWTCMLHYLSLSDENCRQCPICGEAVYRGDLRSVVSHTFTNHSVDEDIVLRLMVREKGCVEVQPYCNTANLTEEGEEEGDPIAQMEARLQADEDIDQYCSQAKLVIVDPVTVITRIVQRERSELLVKLDLDKDEPEVCFVEQALGCLQRRTDKLTQTTSGTTNLKMGRSSQKTPHVFANHTSDLSSNTNRSYLFYQCSDGQHIYLNPFSTKILCHEFSSLENCPATINAKILQMDWISMSESWRKRFRYLEHLPLTCEFRLIEIDFVKSNLISPETYKVFEAQIQRREQEREKRRRDERKREKIIQVEQNRRIYGIQPSLKINLNSVDQFPSVSDERYLGLTQPTRNQSRSDQEYLSDDEEEFGGNREGEIEATESSQMAEVESEAVSSSIAQTNEAAKITLSFRDIQLQEAANEAKSSATQNKNSNVSSNVWATNKGKGSSSSSSQTSSFAQQVINAKTSQKGWTKSSANHQVLAATSSSSSKSGYSLATGSLNTRTVRANHDSDDEGVEELRAPPSEFTISDFIDMNVVSKGKKKGKQLKGLSSKKN